MIGRQRESFLGIARPELGDEEIEEVVATMRSGWLTAGPMVAAFEDALGTYLGGQRVRCLNSCTAGLMLALRLADVGPGDEVLVPANTFVGCANVVEHAGARPVLVDCDPATGLIDLAHAEALVGARTRAIMPVHLAGRPVDLDALARLAARHDLAIVEDAAHAIGARWRGRAVGSFGALCSFSFHAAKNMTTFEGGALVVRDAAEAARVERLAIHGLTRSAWDRHGRPAPDRYDVAEPGYKLAMNDPAAAVGIHQLRRLDGWIERRAQLAAHYDELLGQLPLTPLAPLPDGARHAHHLYVVLVAPDAAVTRDEAIVALGRRKIGASVHFHGVHLHTYYRERYGLRPEDLPGATAWSQRALTLPLHPGLADADLVEVGDALAAVLAPARAA